MTGAVTAAFLVVSTFMRALNTTIAVVAARYIAGARSVRGGRTRRN
jgi:hypothetical protein